MDETMERQNPFCVISKETYGEHGLHDIQTNNAWATNPYGDTYAVVPDEMVAAIRETGGFCDIILNEDGTEIVSFTALEKPVMPEEPTEPTDAERIAELEAKLKAQDELIDILLGIEEEGGAV